MKEQTQAFLKIFRNELLISTTRLGVPTQVIFYEIYSAISIGIHKLFEMPVKMSRPKTGMLPSSCDFGKNWEFRGVFKIPLFIKSGLKKKINLSKIALSRMGIELPALGALLPGWLSFFSYYNAESEIPDIREATHGFFY